MVRDTERHPSVGLFFRGFRREDSIRTLLAALANMPRVRLRVDGLSAEPPSNNSH
jgi:hypothetical protein